MHGEKSSSAEFGSKRTIIAVTAPVVVALIVLTLAPVAARYGDGPEPNAAPATPAEQPTCGGGGPPSEPVWVSDFRFRKVVLKAEVPVLVEFGAGWCLPCRKMVPTLKTLAADFAGRAVIARVDVDREPYLARDFDVVNLPAVLLFQDGRVVRRHIGSRSLDELAGMLEEAIAAPQGQTVVAARKSSAAEAGS